MLSSGDLLQLHGLKERHERMRLPMLQVILAKRIIVKLIHTVQLTGSSAWSSEAQSRYSSTVGQMVERYNFKNVKKYKTQGTSQKMLKTLSYDSGTPLLLTVFNERKVSKRQLRCPQQSWGQEIYFRKKMVRTCLLHWVPIHVEDRPGKNGLLFLDRGAWRALMHILTVNIHSF